MIKIFIPELFQIFFVNTIINYNHIITLCVFKRAKWRYINKYNIQFTSNINTFKRMYICICNIPILTEIVLLL
jgi:hypothetical protein